MKVIRRELLLVVPSDVDDDDASKLMDDLTEYGTRDAELSVRSYACIEGNDIIEKVETDIQDPQPYPFGNVHPWNLTSDQEEQHENWSEECYRWQHLAEAVINRKVFGVCTQRMHDVLLEYEQLDTCPVCKQPTRRD